MSDVFAPHIPASRRSTTARGLTKRAFDLAVTIAAAPVVLPIVLVTAILIRLESAGSPIFRQTRVGRDGRAFTIYKLRTMVQNAERIGAGIYAAVDDERFTRVGLVARRYSLDELPQLLNVLRGEMSIVGPRPMLPVTVQEYVDDYRIILQVKPGITGLAQTRGRNSLPRRVRLELDKEYVRTSGLLLDLRIIMDTFGVAIRGTGQDNTQSRADVER